MRLANRSTRTGKSGGIHLIYFSVVENATYLLTIFSKSDRASYTAAELNDVIANHLAGGSEGK